MVETSSNCEYKTYTLVKKYDNDQDNLGVANEKLLGTDDAIADTDGDGVPDGLEMARRTNPANSKNDDLFGFAELPKEYQQADLDYDGIRDDWEDLYGTNKQNADTDEDGFLDGEELINGFNPNGSGRITYEAATTLNWMQDNLDKLEDSRVPWK